MTPTSLFTWRGWLLTISMILAIALLFSAKGPMQDIHWDAPIYLERGKEIAETAALRDYGLHAKVIAERLPAYKVETDAYTPYWGFMRLGNALLLAMAYDWSGGGMGSIQTAFWLYTLIWATGVLMAAVWAWAMTRYLAPEFKPQDMAWAAVLAALLYVGSDVYRHMSGNFVAEVPALLWLAGSALALLQAQVRRSVQWAALSGALGFALYVTKMDAVLVYIALLAAFAMALLLHGRLRPWWPAFLVSGASAALLYGLYAWYFWPLPDPRLLLVFAHAHEVAGGMNAVPAFKLWFAAGGLLWLGLLPALFFGRRSTALWFALVWLILLTLPHFKGLITASGQTQVRMYTLMLPALLLAAMTGLAPILEWARRGAAGKVLLTILLALAGALAAVAHQETYASLRNLPGGWRLQYLRAFLSPPPYERHHYPLQDLQDIGRALYASGAQSVVVQGEGIPEEYLNILAYLGPSPRRSKIERYAVTPDTMPMGYCGVRAIRLEDGPVWFCLEAPDTTSLKALTGAGVRVLRLHRPEHDAVGGADGEGRVLVRTPRLVLLQET
ncbi:MAG: hypothetical protein ACUVT2_10945 [Thiobacillaceae bacterium]